MHEKGALNLQWGGPKSKRINDLYFSRLNELSNNQQLDPRMRFMARDVIDLRLKNWIPRREEIRIFVTRALTFVLIMTFLRHYTNHF
ncbi:Armadillo-type fold [Artemisia annua]|uniref:Armadillo-type fold n=1 Tax=Artemisia annua TaxID=35608 RepID=A0A2U1LE84_ARTAN|nr:Armadillo-type fold [Artemisia annua]